jgi:diacylglycerol kinase family enzyme
LATSRVPGANDDREDRSEGNALKLVVLVNAAAGTAERQEIEALRAELAAGFEARGLSAEIVPVPGDAMKAAAAEARDRAVRGEIGAVVVGGGDGSVSTVAGVLAGTGVPLGVLPLGTLNHFAKDLGIPTDLAGAMETIARGETRPVDVAEVNGHIFVNNSSVGFYPYMVLERERRRSLHGYRKWTAMLLASLRVLRYFPLRRLAICAEGWTEPWRTPLVFVGNNRYGLAGASLGARERLDRGELCLYVAKQQSRIALLWLALRSYLGFLDRSRDLRTLDVSAAEIRSRKRRLLVAVDGEIDLFRAPLRYRIRPGALKVFARAPADQAQQS